MHDLHERPNVSNLSDKTNFKGMTIHMEKLGLMCLSMKSSKQLDTEADRISRELIGLSVCREFKPSSKKCVATIATAAIK